VFVWISAPVWLTGIGHALVSATNEPRKSDAILVLAGDWEGSRILTACDLVRREMAPVVLVSGPTAWYGINEADAAIRFATANGCDGSKLRPVYIKAFSTVEEAWKLHRELRNAGIRELIIVTSSYHTSRSARVYRRELGDEIRFTMVAAPDEFFEPGTWWKTREGQKTVFFEVSKTVAHWAGL
jgi:uncharacterized SAM-binding protein YcdF (DUF218 family)